MPSVPLTHNKQTSEDPDPSVSDLAAFTCEKMVANADTDEKSQLVALELTKVLS